MNLIRLFSSAAFVIFLNFPSFGEAIAAEQKHALLIVGHQETLTASAIVEMEKTAFLFRQHGVVVHRFYDEQALWEDIIQIAPQCHFFVYCGHGSLLGDGYGAGGLNIDQSVSSAKIREEMNLAEDALVVFQSVCYGAGSSATDNDDIGQEEARNRVSCYAAPFIDIGASSYFAINRVGGSREFIGFLLEGKTLEQAFTDCRRQHHTVEFSTQWTHNPGKSFSIASTPAGGVSTRSSYYGGKLWKTETIPGRKTYNIACIGPMNMTLRE
jgi:hypothetical protein